MMHNLSFKLKHTSTIVYYFFGFIFFSRFRFVFYFCLSFMHEPTALATLTKNDISNNNLLLSIINRMKMIVKLN